MTLPEGQPCFDRVVMNVDVPLSEALDRELSGYGVIVPQAGLLGDGAGNGVIRFVDGIPKSAKHTGSGRTGGEALADIAETGPYRVRLVETSRPVAHREDAAISPAAPAERLAGDAELARRTRDRAHGTNPGEAGDELDAVAAFLADEEKIETIREQATAEARRRAAEWGFDTTDRC
jgi:hypothetical protein